MTCAQALLTLFLIAPCNDGTEEGGSADFSAAVAAAVDNPSRLEIDHQKDATRLPDQILNFLEIAPGMKVLDLFAGGGYYTEILSHLVGDQGSVTSHNNQAYVNYVHEELDQRYTDGKLQNVTRIVNEAEDLQLESNSYDATILMLTYHDFFYADETIQWPDVDETALLDKLCDAMKPDAVLGVIDHIADPGGDIAVVAESIHRIDPARVKTDISASCFEFVGESEVLRNDQDDHSKNVFDPSVKGKTDRFVYKFRRT